MGTYKLKPSSTQVNEGDTITTTLSTIDVITGTTLYYRVVGKGINAKDFSSGALKGTLIVGTDGTATISHTLTADSATEGSESLTIQVFSDKKMKNLVGQSDAVTIADTSVKAVKGGGNAPATSGGTGSNRAYVTEKLTGFASANNPVNIKSDIVYGYDEKKLEAY